MDRTWSPTRWGLAGSSEWISMSVPDRYGTMNVKLTESDRSNDPSSPSKVRTENQPALHPMPDERH